LVGGPQWIDNHLPEAWTDVTQIKFFVTLTKKVIVFVAIRFAVFRLAFGYRFRAFGIQFQGLRTLAGTHFQVVLVFVCLLVFLDWRMRRDSFFAKRAAWKVSAQIRQRSTRSLIRS